MLSSGKIIFFGPRDLVLPFFEGLGFACPPRKNMADFLQEVPMPGGEPGRRAGQGEGGRAGRGREGVGGLGGRTRQAGWLPRLRTSARHQHHHDPWRPSPPASFSSRRPAAPPAPHPPTPTPPHLPPPADQERYWAGDRAAYSFLSSKHIGDAFVRDTEAGRAMAQELEAPYGGGEEHCLAIVESQ